MLFRNNEQAYVLSEHTAKSSILLLIPSFLQCTERKKPDRQSAEPTNGSGSKGPLRENKTVKEKLNGLFVCIHCRRKQGGLQARILFNGELTGIFVSSREDQKEDYEINKSNIIKFLVFTQVF